MANPITRNLYSILFSQSDGKSKSLTIRDANLALGNSGAATSLGMLVSSGVLNSGTAISGVKKMQAIVETQERML